jgi:hypothetical protein
MPFRTFGEHIENLMRATTKIQHHPNAPKKKKKPAHGFRVHN